MQYYFGTQKKLYIKKDKLNELEEYEIGFEDKIVSNVESKLNELDNLIQEYGYMMQKNYNEQVLEVLPKGYKSKLNDYNHKLNTYHRITVRDVYDKLVELGIQINKKSKSGKIILSEKLHSQISI